MTPDWLIFLGGVTSGLCFAVALVSLPRRRPRMGVVRRRSWVGK